MQFKLFMDTNIYDASNYNFRNALFNALRKDAKTSGVKVVINSVIEGEVKSHIKDRITDAVSKLNKALKASCLSSFSKIPDFYNLPEIQEPQVWVKKCFKEFDDFLEDCNVIRISLDNISVEKVMNDYFERVMPFEDGKSDSFKDAFAIESLLLDMDNTFLSDAGMYDEGTIYCIISNDKGFIEAIENNVNEEYVENVRIFGSLIEFIDYMSTMDLDLAYLKAYLLTDYASDEIEETIRQAICNSDFNIEIGLCIEKPEITNIKIREYNPYVLGISEDNGKLTIAKVALTAKCIINVNYEFLDIENSYYDKESGEYLFKTMREGESDFLYDIELAANMDISSIKVPKDWNPYSPNKNSHFDKCKLIFEDYIDIPEFLYLDKEIIRK